MITGSGIAVALDWPHNETSDIECFDCHVMHNSGPSLTQKVDGQAGINNLCISCHNLSGQAASRGDVQTHKYKYYDEDQGQEEGESGPSHEISGTPA